MERTLDLCSQLAFLPQLKERRLVIREADTRR
jgi:hypothetical protein